MPIYCLLTSKVGRCTPVISAQIGTANAAAIGFPGITFHSTRHTHVSQLIDQGVDIVTISKRIGHSSPEVTLRVYSHLFARDDGKAAEALNRVFKTVPRETAD